MPQAQKSGFFSKLAKAAPVIGRVAAAIGAAYGNRGGQQAWAEHDARQRQDRLDTSALESADLQRQRVQQELSAFETPQQKFQRELGEQKQLAEQAASIAPPKFATYGNRVFELPRKAGEGLQDPMQTPPPVSVPLGGQRPDVPNLIPSPPSFPNQASGARLALKESAPYQAPASRQPLEMRSKIARMGWRQGPDGFVPVPLDAFGNEIEDADVAGLLPPAAYLPTQPRTTTRTDPMGAVTTSITSGGGKQIGAPPSQVPPAGSGPSPRPPAAAGVDKLDAVVDAISKGHADLDAYPQKRTRPTDPPSKDEIIRRAQERGLPLLGKKGRALQEDFIAAEESMSTFERALDDFNNTSFLSPMQKASAAFVMKNEANALSRLIGRALGEQRFTDEDKRDFVNVLGPSLVLNTLDPNIAKRQISDLRSTMARIKQRKLATFGGGESVAPATSAPKPPSPAPAGQEWQYSPSRNQWRLVPKR